MSRHASTRRARFQLEHLEDRRTPSALLGGPSAHLLAQHGGPHAAAAAHIRADRGHAVPIAMSLRCAADTTSMTLSARGFATELGHWTAQGHIDTIVSDPLANRVVISGTLTIVTANRDKLFASISSAWQQSTSRVEDTVTITGGTGKYAGASGHASLVCRVTVDSTSPLKLECKGKGSGTLVLAQR
jgi:hypothetical protein